MTERRTLTVGTAGHVDHGKTVLVEALTGTNTDRLPEERRRGMSIVLGFAEIDLGERRLSLVDVPGHERFVRTMIAGAGGVDLFLMVVAADDGVMPQTCEHAAVLEALGIETGVVALTKCDLAGAGACAEAVAAVRELLPRTRVVEVSAVEGAGMETLREALSEAAARLDEEAVCDPGDEAVVLHVDRQFTARGHGIVVTGTLSSGVVARGDRLIVLPGRHEARVRAIQVHNRATDRAGAVQRVALNLTLSGGRQVASGDAIVGPEAPVFETYRLDVALPPRKGEEEDATVAGRVQVHLGTRHAAARLVPLGESFAQLRLEAPLFAQGGDRVVLRRISPLGMIGGAVVVDPVPPRHGPGAATERLKVLAGAGPRELLLATLADGGSLPRRAERLTRDAALAGALNRFPRERWQATLDELVETGAAIERGESIVLRVDEEPPSASTPAPRSHPLAPAVLEQLRRGGFAPPAPAAIAAALDEDDAGVTAALAALVEAGEAVRTRGSVYFAAERLAAATDRALELIERRGALTIAELRDDLAISRKYAQALLEHLDATGLTFRDGDVHRRRGRRSRTPIR
jgi:selenocysteine-specific elongation factor